MRTTPAGTSRRNPRSAPVIAAVAIGLVAVIVASAQGAPRVRVPDGALLVRTFEPDRIGATMPRSIAPTRRGEAIVVAGTGAGLRIVGLSRFGDKASTAPIRVPGLDPVNIAFDARRSRLLAFANDRVYALDAATGAVKGKATVPTDAGRLSVRAPRGAAVDPRSGRVFLLDARGPALVSFTRSTAGTLSARRGSRISLADADLGNVRGIGYDTSTGHLHVGDGAALVELTPRGEIVARRTIPGAAGGRIEAVAFGPTSDLTDGPRRTSAFVVVRRAAGAGTSLLEVSVEDRALFRTAAASFTSTVVRTTDMAVLSPPSPDPSGLHYRADRNRLIVVDGEVEETVSGITHFQGADVWELGLTGSVIRTTNISKKTPTAVPMTNEPTGIAYNPSNGHYYVTDDDARRVYDLNPGADGEIGTADDSFTYFDTAAVGNGDPEGVAVDTINQRIAVSDGVNAQVYVYTYAGTPVSNFDVEQYGIFDPESVEFNAQSGTLLVLGNDSTPIIAETTPGGALVQTIDFSAAASKAPAGLALAPASNGSGLLRYYVVARGIDNNSDPSIVDGKLFELTAPQPPTSGNNPPSVSAGNDQSVTLPSSAALDGTVSDDGLPNPPGVLTTTWSTAGGPGSATFADPSSVDTVASFPAAGTYVLRLSVGDGQYTVFDDVVVTVSSGGGTSTTFEVRVAAGSDDAEESASGSVSLTSSDLELVNDGSDQAVGIRFAGVAIPQGATITNAYVQFQVDETGSTAASLTVRGQAADNAATFPSTSSSVSSRPRTVASVAWTPPAWPTIGIVGADQRTPNLASIMQEIVNRGGWASGNALALIVTGTGRRTAEAFESGAASAPLLHVEYGPPSGNTAPTVTISAPADGSSFTEGTPVTFTGTASDIQDGPLTSSIAWSSSRDGALGTGGSVVAPSLSIGTHTITAAVSDSGGVAGSASITVTIASGSDVIFADGFEGGTFAAWSSALVDAGDLAVSPSAALVGTGGVLATIDDNNAIYLTDTTPLAEPRYRVRFYLDPNGIVMANADRFTLLQGRNGSTSVLTVEMRFASQGGYQIRGLVVADTGSVPSTGWQTITDTSHVVELDWRAASAPGANDGTLTLWIDGVQGGSATGVDNDTLRVETARFGAVSGIDIGTRGTFYLDAFESRRQTPIGP